MAEKESAICKCGTPMVIKHANIAAFQPFAYPIWGTYQFCPNWKWWQLSGHTPGQSWPDREVANG
jgi:hypothetical protein